MSNELGINLPGFSRIMQEFPLTLAGQEKMNATISSVIPNLGTVLLDSAIIAEPCEVGPDMTRPYRASGVIVDENYIRRFVAMISPKRKIDKRVTVEVRLVFIP